MIELDRLSEEAYVEAVRAWDGWQNWLPGDAVTPRLKKAIDAASRVWKKNFISDIRYGFEIEYMDGPMQGIRKCVDQLDSYVVTVSPNMSISQPQRCLYQLKRGTMQYYYINDISL